MADDFRDTDLMGLDLDQLELDHIELDDDAGPSPAWRWFFGLTLLGLTALLVWLPRANIYPALRSPGFTFVFSLSGLLVGLIAGRFLWALLLDMRQRSADKAGASSQPTEEPSAIARWLTFGALVLGAAAIVYATNSGAVQSSGERWFAAAIGAVVIGIGFGRWLTLQAAASATESQPSKPIIRPAWFKWVTLAVLVAGATAVAVVPMVVAVSEQWTLSLSGGGFVVGIGAAIWLARRFEEAEEKAKKKAVR